MFTLSLNRIATLCVVAFLSALVLIGSASGQSDESGNVKTSFKAVRMGGTGPVMPATGTSLSRNNGGVFVTTHVQGLTPGTVVTAWLVAFNNPKYCATNPCSVADIANPDVDASPVYIGGRIIGLDGAATYGAYRSVGDATGWNGGGTGNGLVNPLGAEIHIALRTHGPASADPAILAMQLSTFNGGCPPNMCATFAASIFQR